MWKLGPNKSPLEAVERASVVDHPVHVRLVGYCKKPSCNELSTTVVQPFTCGNELRNSSCEKSVIHLPNMRFGYSVTRSQSHNRFTHFRGLGGNALGFRASSV